MRPSQGVGSGQGSGHGVRGQGAGREGISDMCP